MTDTVPILGQGPQVTPGDVLEMKFSLIRIEEQLKSGAKDAEHRHANMKQAMDAFVPRRELDQIFAGITARLASVDGEMKDKAEKTELDDVKRRVGNVESNQTWVTRTVLGLVIGAIVAAALAFKHG